MRVVPVEDELRTALDDDPAVRDRPDPTPDPVARLEDERRRARLPTSSCAAARPANPAPTTVTRIAREYPSGAPAPRPGATDDRLVTARRTPRRSSPRSIWTAMAGFLTASACAAAVAVGHPAMARPTGRSAGSAPDPDDGPREAATARSCPGRRARCSPPTTSGTRTSAGSRSARAARHGWRACRPRPASCTRTSAPAALRPCRTASRSPSCSGSHAKVPVTVRLRERERPRAVPARRGHEDRGRRELRRRHARDRRGRRDVHPVRDLGHPQGRDGHGTRGRGRSGA